MSSSGAHSQLSETELRVRALESVLTQKDYVDPAALDLLVETYEKKIGPHNGARVVAKARRPADHRCWAALSFREEHVPDVARRWRETNAPGPSPRGPIDLVLVSNR
jgi:nitrile hydratase subunit alpha